MPEALQPRLPQLLHQDLLDVTLGDTVSDRQKEAEPYDNVHNCEWTLKLRAFSEATAS